MARGDHVRVHRPLGYWHHGIMVDKSTVIHFTGEPGGSKTHAQIKASSMDEFLQNGKLEVVHYEECFEPGIVVLRAMTRIGESGYHLIFKNCEHFARWCKIGEEKSGQVKNVLTGTGTSIGVGSAVVGSLGAISMAGSTSGLSGAGIMAGLAAIGPGQVLGGLATLAAAPTLISNVAVHNILEDDEHLSQEERQSRKVGRVAAKVGTTAGIAGTVGTISYTGAVTGLSAAGITSGLAAIGSVVGGGMTIGFAASILAPAAVTTATGFGMYHLWKKIKKNS